MTDHFVEVPKKVLRRCWIMTTTPDFRALGAKIVELWDADCDIHVEINELRELLATPPPEPPTDEEIQEWADAKLGAAEQGDPDAFGRGWRCFHREAFARTIRAALERWGR